MTGGAHPTTTLRDFYLVEDTTKNLFVSSMCLIPQTWTYEGIHFGVGRPEIVMTLPEYRRRGLVRAQFDALHADCAARGLPVQAITGIPHFYRQFGYEYTLELDGAWTGLFLDAIPDLKDGKAEPFTTRRMTEADLPAVMDMAHAYARDKMVTCVRDEAYWRFALGESSHLAGAAYHVLLEAASGRVVGYFGERHRHWGPWLAALELALAEGVSYLSVTPSLLRAMRAMVETRYATPDDPTRQLAFWLGGEHPVYQVLKRYGGAARRPYAWYVRVPDVLGFVRRIAPALEARLAESAAAGHTGELRVDFYSKPGLRVRFEAGRLVEVAPLGLPAQDANAGCPPLVFLQLLFGHRSLDEVRHAFPDVWAWAEGEVLLEALFPRRPSWIVPLH